MSQQLQTRAGSRPVWSSPHLRALAWWRRASLDRALAAGANGSALLCIRGDQLVKPASRAQIADGIELAMADEAARARGRGATPLQRVSIALAHAELVWLVAALRATPDASPQAVAMALQLVTDNASPLYTPASATALRAAARRISAQLLATR